MSCSANTNCIQFKARVAKCQDGVLRFALVKFRTYPLSLGLWEQVPLFQIQQPLFWVACGHQIGDALWKSPRKNCMNLVNIVAKSKIYDISLYPTIMSMFSRRTEIGRRRALKRWNRIVRLQDITLGHLNGALLKRVYTVLRNDDATRSTRVPYAEKLDIQSVVGNTHITRVKRAASEFAKILRGSSLARITLEISFKIGPGRFLRIITFPWHEFGESSQFSGVVKKWLSYGGEN